MNREVQAEEQYQQGLHYAHLQPGEYRENLQRAIALYSEALQYYTEEDFPEKWVQIQRDMAAAYSELAQEHIKDREKPTVSPVMAALKRRRYMLQIVLLAIVIIVILAIPFTAIATGLVGSDVSCVSGTLNIDGSTALQPLVQAEAQHYMQRCNGANITVGGGASKTGLADVEQGRNMITGIDPGQDKDHIEGKDVPIGIGDSDIFASPVQHDLIDHQVAIGVFVMIVNHDVVGITDLSTEQIQGIYTGKYQNWQQICDRKHHCGPDLPIFPISRTVSSGTRFTFEKYVLRGVATVPGLGLDRVNTSGNAVQEVANNAGSIGYAPLYLADQNHAVVQLSINGKRANDTSVIQNGQYTFWNIEHMYTRGTGSALARAFISSLYSQTSASLLTRFDFLPLMVVPQSLRQTHIFESQ